MVNVTDTHSSNQPGAAPHITGRAAFAHTPGSSLMVLAVFFVAVMMISTITGTKGVQIGPFNLDGAFYLFPLAYVLGDVISEVYGFKVMRRVVWAGFFALLVMSLCMWITIELPGADFYEHQEAFRTVAGVVPRILAASLAGYLAGELLNSWVLVKIKEHTGERSLWARLLGSTLVGEAADTLIFCSIAAGAIGITGWGDFWNYVLVGYVWKTLIEVVVMPITYLVVRWLKKREPTYQQALAKIEASEQ